MHHARLLAVGNRKNPFSRTRLGSVESSVGGDLAGSSGGAADPEIAHQQRESLMADSEAQVAVWTELVLVFFHLSAALSDEEFKVFLPLLFPGVKSLTAYAKDDKLKQQIAEFFQRVASIFGFDPEI